MLAVIYHHKLWLCMFFSHQKARAAVINFDIDFQSIHNPLIFPTHMESHRSLCQSLNSRKKRPFDTTNLSSFQTWQYNVCFGN